HDVATNIPRWAPPSLRPMGAVREQLTPPRVAEVPQLPMLCGRTGVPLRRDFLPDRGYQRLEVGTAFRRDALKRRQAGLHGSPCPEHGEDYRLHAPEEPEPRTAARLDLADERLDSFALASHGVRQQQHALPLERLRLQWLDSLARRCASLFLLAFH